MTSAQYCRIGSSMRSCPADAGITNDFATSPSSSVGPEIGSHGGGRRSPPRCRELREAKQQGAFGLGEQLVAPLDERSHRCVAPVTAAPARTQLVEVLVERVGQLARVDLAQPGDDELDTERHVLDAIAEPSGEGGAGSRGAPTAAARCCRRSSAASVSREPSA